MAENIELIAAKDLPITEAEEVSVLCVDNGELKQKPGASFGGGGGYIVVADEVDMESMQGTINESYDNFIGVLLKGGSVWIDMSAAAGNPTYVIATAWVYDGAAIVLLGFVNGTPLQFVCPNGTWAPEV